MGFAGLDGDESGTISEDESELSCSGGELRCGLVERERGGCDTRKRGSKGIRRTRAFVRR